MLESAEKPAELFYFFDPMCSWCWGFSRHFERLYQHYSSQVSITMVVGGLRSEQQPLSDDKRDSILGHWRRVHEASGQPFDFDRALPSGFCYDTEPACRAVVVFRESYKSHQLSYVSRIQQAFYVEGQDLTDSDVLANLAAEQGIDREHFLQLHHSDEMKAKTQSDFERTAGLGVQGFPTLALKNEQGWIGVSQGYLDWDSLNTRLSSRLAFL